jgi:hypothetical protein
MWKNQKSDFSQKFSFKIPDKPVKAAYPGMGFPIPGTVLYKLKKMFLEP